MNPGFPPIHHIPEFARFRVFVVLREPHQLSKGAEELHILASVPYCSTYMHKRVCRCPSPLFFFQNSFLIVCFIYMARYFKATNNTLSDYTAKSCSKAPPIFMSHDCNTAFLRNKKIVRYNFSSSARITLLWWLSGYGSRLRRARAG